jgi:hypothetical protein
VTEQAPSWWPRCDASRGTGRACRVNLIAVKKPGEEGIHFVCQKHCLRFFVDLVDLGDLDDRLADDLNTWWHSV